MIKKNCRYEEQVPTALHTRMLFLCCRTGNISSFNLFTSGMPSRCPSRPLACTCSRRQPPVPAHVCSETFSPPFTSFLPGVIHRFYLWKTSITIVFISIVYALHFLSSPFDFLQHKLMAASCYGWRLNASIGDPQDLMKRLERHFLNIST